MSQGEYERANLANEVERLKKILEILQIENQTLKSHSVPTHQNNTFVSQATSQISERTKKNYCAYCKRVGNHKIQDCNALSKKNLRLKKINEDSEINCNLNKIIKIALIAAVMGLSINIFKKYF